MNRIESSASDPRSTRPPKLAVTPQAETAAPAMAGDALQLSTGRKLVEGNKRALKLAGGMLLDILTHPLRTLGSMARAAVDMVLHPRRMQDSIVAAYKKSPVDGAIQGLMIASSLVGVAALLTMAVAYGGALVTGGASLAILPAAGAVAAWAGPLGVAAMAASFIKNQFDVAGAKTTAELERESQELAQDFSSLGLAGATTAIAHGATALARKFKPKNVNPSAAQRAATRVKDQIKKKVSHPIGEPNANTRGIKIDGKGRDQFRARAAQEVRDALEESVQGPRPITINDLDMGSFEGVERLGEHRMVFHGTRSEISPLIRENGLKVSEIGDYGGGLYFGGSAKIGVNYADDVSLGRSLSASSQPVVYVAEMAPGKVLDYAVQKQSFLKWAKARFDPSDLSDPLNQLYHKPNVPVSKMVDNTWTRYLPQYCQEMGYDCILIRDWDGPGLDYWVVHDPKRVVLREEILLGTPGNKYLVPPGFDGQIGATLHATDQRAPRER